MCGSSGPSSAELVAQEKAAQARAQAEADKVRAEQDLGKQNENARVVADQAAMANADAARRRRNRTLLAGLGNEEGSLLDPTGAQLDMSLEDPTRSSSKKARRAATLIGG